MLESVASVIQALPAGQSIEPLLVRPAILDGDPLGLTCLTHQTLVLPVLDKLSTTLATPLSPALQEIVLQQLSYLTALAQGLSDPDGDLLDLDLSVDEQVLINESSRTLADARMIQMRSTLSSVLQGLAVTWKHDAEVSQALVEFIKTSTSDSVPTSLSLPVFSLFSLALASLQTSTPNPTWLVLSSILLGRMARERSARDLSGEEMKNFAAVVEAALELILTGFAPVASESIPLGSVILPCAD